MTDIYLGTYTIEYSEETFAYKHYYSLLTLIIIIVYLRTLLLSPEATFPLRNYKYIGKII